MCSYRCRKRTAGCIQRIPAGYLSFLQVRSNLSICFHCSHVIYRNLPGSGVYPFRNFHNGNSVSDKGNKAPDNFSKQEYFNILFDFIPLCAGNSACFDNSKIFYRSCLDWLGLL